MYGRVLLAATGLLAIGSVSAAQEAPFRRAQPRLEDPQSLTEGDSPLTTLEVFSGNVDVEIDVVPHLFTTPSSGTFTITGIPAGATVLRAWFQVTSFDAFPDLELTIDFEGNVVGPRPADVVDPASSLFCSLWRYDVTEFVPGNGEYDYTASGHERTFGDSLIVVFEHPDLPPSTVIINDGSEGLQDSTTTTPFEGLPEGAGELFLFAQAVDRSGEEEVVFNGDTIAFGSVFVANQGPAASLLEFPVDVLAGTNTLDVSTVGDFFGLHLAVLRVDGLAPECFLVIGDGPGHEMFDAGLHEWATQLSGISLYYPVTMVDIPTFEIPIEPRTRRRGPRTEVGGFAVQVLMWNPGEFPTNPEQSTDVLVVTMWSDGTASAVPHGSQDGMAISLETHVVDGRRHVRFPFTIEGL